MSSAIKTSDFLIVGAGIIGLTLARELKIRYPDAHIRILEKEPSLGKHSSGRNSGVLHTGIYYAEGSLKAKICQSGAQALYQYCMEHELPLQKVGKVILPIKVDDDSQLELLYQRGICNGVELEWLDTKQLKSLEPEAHSITGKALYSPFTSVFDPLSILDNLQQELEAQSVEILFNQKVVSADSKQRLVKTTHSQFSYAHLFNTSGLYADKIAAAFGITNKYTMIPFKGLYYTLDPASGIAINHHIYPVPDLNMPFLGVHFTRGISGGVYLGPTAVPAFGRENYRGLEGIEPGEILGILTNLAQLYVLNRQGFRDFAHEECPRYIKKYFVQAAQSLVPNLKPAFLKPSNKVGIRAQLYNQETQSLIMDFLVEQGENSTHILNAVSPAFTCSLTFARFILDSFFENSITTVVTREVQCS